MLGIDTNVLVRFLVRDDEAQFEKARRLIRREVDARGEDRKSTRLNSSHSQISYAVFCLKKQMDDLCVGASARRSRRARDLHGPSSVLQSFSVCRSRRLPIGGAPASSAHAPRSWHYDPLS